MGSKRRFTEYDASPPIELLHTKKDEEAIEWLFKRGFISPVQSLKLHAKVRKRWKAISGDGGARRAAEARRRG